jgi:predicted nucleic acid-binding protein
LIVVDASAIVELLLATSVGAAVEARLFDRHEAIHAPHLLDLEVASVFRRLVRQRIVSTDAAQTAIDDLPKIGIIRYSHDFLLPRIWELRHNLTVYDAAYVSLAELLEAPLITCDARLAKAAGPGARIETF